MKLSREQLKSAAEKAKNYYKEHPEKLSLKDTLLDLGITHIQKEVYLMAAKGMPFEVIEAYANKRREELCTLLGIETKES